MISEAPTLPRVCTLCGSILTVTEVDGEVRYVHGRPAAHPPLIGPLVIPEYFVPTSTSPRWQGKIRCFYCGVTGWPRTQGNLFWWGLDHGAACRKAPSL